MIRTTSERAHGRWANLPPLLRWLTGALVMAAIGVGVVKPAYRSVKAWRMQQHLAAARTAVGDSRMTDARDLSLTVLRGGGAGLEGGRFFFR